MIDRVDKTRKYYALHRDIVSGKGYWFSAVTVVAASAKEVRHFVAQQKRERTLRNAWMIENGPAHREVIAHIHGEQPDWCFYVNRKDLFDEAQLVDILSAHVLEAYQ